MENLIKITMFIIMPLLVAGVLISCIMFIRERVLAMPKLKIRKLTKKQDAAVTISLALVCLVAVVWISIARR